MAKSGDRSTWGIGGTTLIGGGVGLIFLKTSALLFSASNLIGIGAGLLAPLSYVTIGFAKACRLILPIRASILPIMCVAVTPVVVSSWSSVAGLRGALWEGKVCSCSISNQFRPNIQIYLQEKY